MNKNFGVKNIFYGIVSLIITTGLGVVIPRLVLVNLGSESNGLMTSVGNILSYMSLLEAGVGGATLNALYTPLGKRDYGAVNAIMAATDHFYKRTGRIYLALVAVVSVLFTLFVESALPRRVVFAVVLLSGLSGVISYFFQGKFTILLSAEGRGYIQTNISTVVSTATSIGKIVLLSLGFDVVALQILHLVLTLIQMAVILIYIKRNYKWVDLSVTPNFKAISQKNAVIVHQISGLIFTSTDVFVLTLFTSLKTVSVYSLYVMIFGMVKAIAVTVTQGYTYSLGQIFSDRPAFFRLFDAFETFQLAFTSAVFCVAGNLMTPFVKLYTAGVNDINYTDKYLPWLFVAFYIMHNGRQSSMTVINLAQRFKETKWRSILESVINVVSSLVLTWFFGIYGVLMGTIAALLYRTNDMIIYAAKILNRSCFITYRRWIPNILLIVGMSVICSRFNFDLSNYFNLTVYGICLSVAALILFLGVAALLERESAKYVLHILRGFIKKDRA